MLLLIKTRKSCIYYMYLDSYLDFSLQTKLLFTFQKMLPPLIKTLESCINLYLWVYFSLQTKLLFMFQRNVPQKCCC